jgi:predicted ATP-grasp superfamily ATP-dependent carboligase
MYKIGPQSYQSISPILEAQHGLGKPPIRVYRSEVGLLLLSKDHTLDAGKSEIKFRA